MNNNQEAQMTSDKLIAKYEDELVADFDYAREEALKWGDHECFPGATARHQEFVDFCYQRMLDTWEGQTEEEIVLFYS